MKLSTGGAAISSGPTLPAGSETVDGTLFLKSGSAPGLYIFNFDPDANSGAFGEQGVQDWRQLVDISGVYPFVLKAGDTMTGPLVIQSTNNVNSLTLRQTSAGVGTELNVKITENTGATLDVTDGGSTARALIMTQVGVEKLRLDSTGNLGVGSTAPGRLVTLDGGAATTYLQLTNTAAGAGAGNGLEFVLDSTGTNATITNREAGFLSFETSGVERVRIASTGALTINSSAVAIPNGLNFDSNTLVIDAANNRIGVGESPAIAKLQVAGGTNDQVLLLSSDSSPVFSMYQGGVRQFFILNNGTEARIVAEPAIPMVFRTDNAARLRIEATGATVPAANNTYSCGTAALQWSDVRSVLGTFTGAISNSFSGTGYAQTSNNTGGINDLIVQNTGTSGTSNARLLVSASSGTGGDAFTTYAASSVNWSTGIDRSASSSYVISLAAGVGTGNVFEASTAGNVVIPMGALSVSGGNFDTTRPVSGGVVSSATTNSSNTASSDAAIVVNVAGTSAGDPYIYWAVNTAGSYVLGIDNSASDAFVGSVGAVLGTNNWLSVATNGAVTFPDADGVTVTGPLTASGGSFSGQISSSVNDLALTQTSANSGGTSGIQISNTANTASSQSLMLLSVGGSSAGDPYTRYNVSGVVNWATGVDNSDADAFVISAGQEPGTNNVLRAAIGGDVTIPLGNFRVLRALSGTAVVSEVFNSSNTAGSDAMLLANVVGASAGDPHTRYNVNGVSDWVVGLDNSDSDSFVISQGANIGTNNVFRVATAGDITVPLGNFNTTRAASGSAVANTIFNTSNTASSNAFLNVVVGGASGGDAYAGFTVNGVQSWALGIDNSDGDSFVISRASALGTDNFLRVATTGNSTFPGGAVTFNGGNVDVTRSASGGDVLATVHNSSNTASSSATLQILTAGSSAADAAMIFGVLGATTWIVGVDNSASDAFVGSVGGALGTNNWLSVATDGAVTFPDADGVTISGPLVANGNITLGDAIGDTLTVNATATFVNDLSANGNVNLGNASGDTITFNGTPAGQVVSGTWTPTFTAVTNISNVIGVSFGRYMRIGNTVTFAVAVNIQPTAGSVNTAIRFTLPIASDFVGAQNAHGTAVRSTILATSIAGWCQADTGNDQIVMNYINDSSTSLFMWNIQGMYQII